MLHSLLRRQQQTEDVEVELPVKEVLGHLLERRELVDAGVVDQDVEPAECLLAFGKQALDVRLLRYVTLHGDGLAPAAHDLRHHTLGALLAGRVVDDDGEPEPIDVERARRLQVRAVDVHMEDPSVVQHGRPPFKIAIAGDHAKWRRLVGHA